MPVGDKSDRMHNMLRLIPKFVLLFTLLVAATSAQTTGVDLHKLGHIRHLMGAWGPQHLLTEVKREGFIVWGKLQIANRDLHFLAVNSMPSLVLIGFDQDNFFSIGHSQWNREGWKALGAEVKEPFNTWVNQSLTTMAVVNLCMNVRIPGRTQSNYICHEIPEKSMRTLLTSGELSMPDAHTQDNFYIHPTFKFYQPSHAWTYQPPVADVDSLKLPADQRLRVLPVPDQDIAPVLKWIRNEDLKSFRVFLQSLQRMSMQPLTTLQDNLWTNGQELFQINEDGDKWKLYISTGGVLQSKVNRKMHELIEFQNAIQWDWRDEMQIIGNSTLAELPIGTMKYRESAQNSSLSVVEMIPNWGPIQWSDLFSEQRLIAESEVFEFDARIKFPEGWQNGIVKLDHSAYKLEGKIEGSMLQSQISINLTMPIPGSSFAPAPYHLRLYPSKELLADLRQSAFEGVRAELEKDKFSEFKHKQRLINNPDFGTTMLPGMHTEEHALSHDQRLAMLDLQIMQEQLTTEHTKVLKAIAAQEKLREKWLQKKNQTQLELEKMQSIIATEWVNLPEYQDMWTNLKIAMKQIEKSNGQQESTSGGLPITDSMPSAMLSSGQTITTGIRVLENSEGMTQLAAAMNSSDQIESALSKQIQQLETYLETLQIRKDQLESHREQIKARQNKFLELESRRGSSLKIWEEYLDAARKVMAENDPKRFLRENPDPGEIEKCVKSGCKRSITKCSGRPRKCLDVCIEWDQKCEVLEHPTRGNWRLDLKARQEAHAMAAYQTTRYKQLIALNQDRSQQLDNSRAGREIIRLEEELKEIKADTVLAQHKLSALNKQMSQHLLKQEQLDLQDFAFAEDLKAFKQKYDEIKQRYNSTSEPINKFAKVLELNSLAIKQQARFLKRWKTANEQLNELDSREAPLRLKLAALEDRLLKNFEENTNLRSQSDGSSSPNSNKEIALNRARRKISSVRRQTLQVIDSRMDRVQTFIERHQHDSGSSFTYFTLTDLHYSDDLQAKQSDYVECNASVEFFGRQFVLRTFPWDRTLASLKKHIREQMPLLLQQRQLQIHELPDTRKLFEDDTLAHDSKESEVSPFDQSIAKD